MSSLWIPLPFPNCPRCNSSWVRCYHKNCVLEGEILVEPHLGQAKCGGCEKNWILMETTFHCSCGHVFSAGSVSEALSTASLIRQKLLKQIEGMDKAEIRIRQTVSHSFSQWLEEMSYKLGFTLGTIATYLKKWIETL
jgi:hypothetical protein